MKRCPPLLVLFHAIVWIVLCSAYLVAGGRTASRALTAESITTVTPATPFHSSDLYLQELTGMRNGSQRFIQIFAAMSPHKLVYVFVPEGEEYCSFVGVIIAYLGWPVEVQTIPVRKDNAEGELRSLDPASCAAIIFCGLKLPPWITSGIQVGSNLVIVPVDSGRKDEP